MIRRRPFVTAAALSAVFLCPALFAGPGRNGMFILFSGQALEFQRDLTVNRTLWHFEKAFSIPRLDRDTALAVGIGGKNRGGTWDVSFLHSTQTAMFEDGSRTVTFQALEINGRSFFFKKFFIHPYFQGGISIPFIRVENGASYEGAISNAAYFGAGLNAGAGLMIEVGPSILFNAGLMYRWIGFLYAFGGGKGRDINNLRVEYLGPEFGRLLRTDTVTLTAGLGFVF